MEQGHDLQSIMRRMTAQPVPPARQPIQRSQFIPTMRSTDDASRTITFVSSTEDIDRYGDVIRVAGWDTKNYMRNPVFLWGHKSGEPPIGKCIGIHTEKTPKPALVQKIEFADAATYPFADSIYRLYKGGFLKAVSVGFRPLTQPNHIVDSNNEWTGGYEFTSQELMELSAVPVPANPLALARAVDEGYVGRADAIRAFSGDEFFDDAESWRPATKKTAAANTEVELARSLLQARARVGFNQVIRCSDDEAILRARLITVHDKFQRLLATIQVATEQPAMPLEMLLEIDDILRNWLRDWDASDFERELTTQPPTLDDFLGLLGSSEN